MKKLIILFLILSILIVGCSNNQTYERKTSQQPSPSVGGGCSVSEADEQETKIRYTQVQASL